jgi:6-phosphogluconolactonase
VIPYTIGANGALSQGTAVAASGGSSEAKAAVVDPSGRFLFVSDWDNDSVYVYSINQTSGALTAVSGSPFSNGFTSFTNDSNGIAVDPTGRFAYVVEYDTDVAGFSINRFTGALTTLSGSPWAAGTNPASVAVDATGKYLFIAEASGNQLLRFPISATGTLGASTSIAVGTLPKFVAIDPASRFVYASNYTPGTVSAFSLNAYTGAVSAVSGSPFSSGTNAQSLAVDPSGGFLLVGNAGANNVAQFGITQGTGVIAAISGSPYTVGTTPRWVSFTSAIQ